MPPEFPHFEPLSHKHRPHIESHTTPFPPYSDFNFTSLWSWDTDTLVQHTTLYGNLVVRFTDYVTRKPFYSFIGNRSVNETADQLLRLAKQEGLEPVLKLIPEETVGGLDHQRFRIEEDPDNFDYILSAEKMKSLEGSHFQTQRKKLHKFLRTHQTQTVILDISEPSVQKDLQALFLKWEAWKQLPRSQTENEMKAVLRLHDPSTANGLVTIGVRLGDELIGFTISEIQRDGYGMLHFEKALPLGFTGISQYLKQETARILSNHGCKLLNCQQDLGIPGLRTYKMDLSPVGFLRKYRVAPNE